MKTKSILIISLLSLGLFMACSKSPLPDRTMVATGARVVFINFSQDSPEINLYFNGNRVTTQQSTVVGKLRGIPFRSSYPGSITQIPAATTVPTPYIGMEYFVTPEGTTAIVAKDTGVVAAPITFFTTSFNFVKDKYYSVFATDAKATMTPMIIEDNIVPFTTVKKTKLRVVNALSGVAGNSIDVWMIPQPSLTAWAFAPYKLASGLAYQQATTFADTTSQYNWGYKWMVVKAGAVPTANTAPTVIGTSYNLTFAAADIIINKVTATNTTFADRTTYSLLIYGKFGATGVAAPYGSFFRNRLM
jgi:hypothetical protein